MDNAILKKRLNTYKSAKGTLKDVSNDVVFLSAEGIRSVGIAAASGNLQAGFFGKQIDPLVKAALRSAADRERAVQSTTMLPCASICALTPGGRTVVVSYCSTTAGPMIRSPARRRARS